MCPEAEASNIPHCHHYTEKRAGIFHELTKNNFDLSKVLQNHVSK